jgi:hypothetical protein
MEYFVGLDVSLEATAVCVVDGEGKTIRESMVETDPDALAGFLTALNLPLTRIGLEAGFDDTLAVSQPQRGGFGGDLHRDAARQGGTQGADGEDRPERCARSCADHAHRLVSGAEVGPEAAIGGYDDRGGTRPTASRERIGQVGRPKGARPVSKTKLSHGGVAGVLRAAGASNRPESHR